jgi:hypothetical protein
LIREVEIFVSFVILGLLDIFATSAYEIELEAELQVGVGKITVLFILLLGNNSSVFKAALCLVHDRNNSLSKADTSRQRGFSRFVKSE